MRFVWDQQWFLSVDNVQGVGSDRDIIASTTREYIPFNNVRTFAEIILCPKAHTVLYILQLYLRTMIHSTPLTLYLDPWTIILKHHSSKWNIIHLNCAFYLSNHLSVHTIWNIQIQDPRHRLWYWALLYIKDTVDVLLTRFQYDITYQDFFIFHYFRYLNLYQCLMKYYAVVQTLATLSWPSWSFTLLFS